MASEVKLKVAAALMTDVGRSVARLDSQTRKALGLVSGDYIKIRGTKTTVAIYWPAKRNDENLGIIRMDGFLRANAGVRLGETVYVSKTTLPDATRVILTTRRRRFTRDFIELLKSHLLNKPLTKGDLVNMSLGGTDFQFRVASILPSKSARVAPNTRLDIQFSERDVEERPSQTVTYEDIGGLGPQLEKIREMIELPLRVPELFKRLGITPPKGVLLQGPPGTGKTLIAKAVANESGAHFITINGPEIMSKFYGASEQRIRQVFKEAEENAPSIIFIDEIDSIAPKRSEVTGEVERRVVAQLLALMDGLEQRGDVIVIGATNRPDALDEALRRPGRFDREIEIGVPDKKGRLEILQIHVRGMPLAKDVDLEKIAAITHGFVGADIAALCREAAMHALRRALPHVDLESGTIPPEVLNSLEVTHADFEAAFNDVHPSAMREVFVESPNVHWEDIGGLHDIKVKLQEAVEVPFKKPSVFNEMGIRPPRGVLLFGPPGTGKTMLAKAIATESEANFISVRGPEVFNKYVGETEKAIRDIFKKARQVAPCVVFFDEIDAIASSRGRSVDSAVAERLVNQLLAEMDGLSSLRHVVVIGATNRADMLDPAILRPGRFDEILFVPAPDEDARVEILKVQTKNMPIDESVDLRRIAQMTEGYTGADIEALCREAAMHAIRENWTPRKVTMADFENALKVVPPSLSPEELKAYYKMAENLRKRKPMSTKPTGIYV